MNASRNVAQLLTTACLLAAVGCATSGHPVEATASVSLQGGESARREGRPGRIVAGDLSKVQGATALDAVRQLRPEFLHTTGRRVSLGAPIPPPAVYENEKFAGAVDVLNLIPISVVVEIRRMNPVEARSMFGPACSCDGGVILVRTVP